MTHEGSVHGVAILLSSLADDVPALVHLLGGMDIETLRWTTIYLARFAAGFAREYGALAGCDDVVPALQQLAAQLQLAGPS